jgi:hypothetical protein
MYIKFLCFSPQIFPVSSENKWKNFYNGYKPLLVSRSCKWGITLLGAEEYGGIVFSAVRGELPVSLVRTLKAPATVVPIFDANQQVLVQSMDWEAP